MNINVGLEKVWTLLSEKLESWFVIGVKSLPNFVVALIVVFIFYLLARLGRKVTENILSRMTGSLSVKNLAASLAFLIILIFGIFIALGILQLDKAVTSLLAGAGVIGLALGFAFQDIASNFVSGIFIAFTRPYKVGDIIESGDYMGNVTAINLRTTIITTFQGLEVFMPNRLLFTDPMTNYTNKPQRRIDIAVGVSYGDNLAKVQRLLTEELKSLPNRIEREEVDVFFTEFGDSSINLEARVWVYYPNHRNFLITRSEAIKKIKSVFDDNDIMIPFPIRTLDFGIKGGEKLSAMISQRPRSD